MEGQSRCSHKYLLLQVWCGLLTVAMVCMATFLTSIKQKPTEHEVSTLKPVNVSTTASTPLPPAKLIGSPFSCIQLTKFNNTWHQKERCAGGALTQHDDSIHCTKAGLYFVYAHVTFSSLNTSSKSVLLKRNARPPSRQDWKLVEGTDPRTTQGSVWVAKIVRLRVNDTISLKITGDVRRSDSETFWGAYQLQ